MEEVFRNPLLMFHKSDFPGRRDTEPWMVHIAEADWTQGHYQILHRHEDFSEIFILLEGNGKYTIGGRLYELQQGDVVLCNQGVMHDEFPAKCDSYRTLAVGIAGLYIPELKPGLLIDPSCTPVLRRSEQTEELKLHAQTAAGSRGTAAHYSARCRSVFKRDRSALCLGRAVPE